MLKLFYRDEGDEGDKISNHLKILNLEYVVLNQNSFCLGFLPLSPVSPSSLSN
jgi:hypothetical protein